MWENAKYVHSVDKICCKFQIWYFRKNVSSESRFVAWQTDRHEKACSHYWLWELVWEMIVEWRGLCTVVSAWGYKCAISIIGLQNKSKCVNQLTKYKFHIRCLVGCLDILFLRVWSIWNPRSKTLLKILPSFF